MAVEEDDGSGTKVGVAEGAMAVGVCVSSAAAWVLVIVRVGEGLGSPEDMGRGRVSRPERESSERQSAITAALVRVVHRTRPRLPGTWAILAP